jgi:hypothetical protein
MEEGADMTVPDGVVIERVVVPAAMDAPDAAAFADMAEVRNLVARERNGHDDFAYAAEELLPIWQNQEDVAHAGWIARREGVPIARFVTTLPQEAGSEVAEFALEIREADFSPELVDAGFAFVEGHARAHGRRIMQGETDHRPADGDTVTAASGHGALPRDEYARAYLARGYSLEQVDRASAFDLHGDWARVEKLEGEARAEAAGYRLVSWTVPTPEEYVAGYAALMSRMSTDAPSAGLVWDEEHWDAARLRRHEREILDGGRFGSIMAAQHIASGELVAFTELFVDSTRTGVTEQAATLVRRADRGHRLGLWIKAANLLAWREVAPRSPRVSTMNAEENRPMLEINEALGFVAVSFTGGWKKVLSD